MTPVLTRPRPAQARNAPPLSVVLIVLFGLAAEVVAWRAIRLPSFVDRVTVENPTVYSLKVDVAGVDRDGWVRLGTVEREGEASFHEVIDQGDHWVFRFAYVGVDGGELKTTQADLARNGWRVRITPDVERRLAAAGLEPSAR